jgi:hypothetical protein
MFTKRNDKASGQLANRAIQVKDDRLCRHVAPIGYRIRSGAGTGT